MLVELHTHSTFSDGSYTPTELVEECVQKNIGVLAITDHDSWEGIAEAEEAARKYSDRIKIIAGVELSAQEDEASVHILAYRIDTNCSKLYDRMNALRYGRELRLTKILAKLADLGYNITIEECDPFNRAVGRPHVAKALVAKGYFKTVQEVFDVLLHNGGPAYVPHPKLSVEEAAELIHLAGGIAVLAHPSELKDGEMPERILARKCLDGIEVYHPCADAEDRKKWLKLAEQYDVLVAGGSDFHGLPDRFPPALGIWQVEDRQVKKLLELCK